MLAPPHRPDDRATAAGRPAAASALAPAVASDPGSVRCGWRLGAEYRAALVATLALLPPLLTQGVLAFAALGGEGASLGVAAALVGSVAGLLVLALLGASRMPAGGPGASVALVYAALVGRIALDPQFDAADPAQVAALWGLASAAVVLMGLLQLGFAALRLARLAQAVPAPVLAGFMNGVATLLLLSQLPALLQLPVARWQDLGAAVSDGLLADALPGALLLGLVVAAAYLAATRRLPRLPGALLVLAGATALYHLLAAWAPGVGLGGTLGALALPQQVSPLPGLAGSAEAAALWQRHAGTALSMAAVLALIGALDAVLCTVATDRVLDTRTPLDRELAAFGAANVASGLLGGLPLTVLRAMSLPALRAGGRTRMTVLATAMLTAALALLALPVLAWVPTVALAGVMLAMAWVLVDPWSLRLLARWRGGERSPLLRLDLAVIALVWAVTLVWGFVAGIAAGLAAALLLFVRHMDRTLLRWAGTARQRPSRRVWPPQQESVLAGRRERVAVIELEGALFFGSAPRLADEVERRSAGARAVVLDLARVSALDISGAVALEHLARRLQQHGVALLLAGVAPEGRHERTLRDAGLPLAGAPSAPAAPAAPAAEAAAAPPGPSPHAVPRFDDTDRAVEAAERLLLADAGAAAAPEGALALAECALLQGLDAPAQQRVAARMTRRELAVGELLFRQGDPGDRLHVLVQGSLSIVARPPVGAAPSQRFVSFSPGLMVGEVALLDGGGRTATAVADAPSVVMELGAQALADLGRDDPALAAQLWRNMAADLAQRLRRAPAP
jgi:MFS superfamily sulfate permease-like transporter